jgi:hypothetical protein
MWSTSFTKPCNVLVVTFKPRCFRTDYKVVTTEWEVPMLSSCLFSNRAWPWLNTS